MTLSRAMRFSIIVLLLLSFSSLTAQEADDETSPREQEVRSLVQFFEYMLNTVGSQKTSTRDKEVIITESYQKIFENDLVQIEDDLIPDRRVITNKNVDAYLRDVDFFFEHISFDFENIVIEEKAKSDESTFYLVSFENVIDGITIEGEPFRSNNQRFIEINVDVDEADLRIASVYTNKMSREKELRRWWSSLSYEWIKIFKDRIPHDSISAQVLNQMAEIDSLNISGNAYIVSAEPLAALKNLNYLNISNTQIVDLKPLRYANELRYLLINETPISDLSVLQYFEELRELQASGTLITDISDVKRLKKLEVLALANIDSADFRALEVLTDLKRLDLTNSNVSNIDFLQPLKSLTDLSLAGTAIEDISVFSELRNLESLDLSKTSITTMEALDAHPSLRELNIEYTAIEDLKPLLNVSPLKKILADYTTISSKDASTFMSKKPGTIVISNSDKIEKWWLSLSPKWKEKILSNVRFEPDGKEDLIRLINIDSLDVSNGEFINPNPLEIFNGVTYLNVSGNYFNNLNFLSTFDRIQALKADSLPISSAESISNLTGLQSLSLKGSSLKSLSGLKTLQNLKLLNVDNTDISENDVRSLIQANPEVVVIFKSNELKNWWDGLSGEWKEAFNLKTIDSFHLHQLIESEQVSVSNTQIQSLEPLGPFINLKEVDFNQTLITDLSPLSQHTDLTSITCTNGPLKMLEGIKGLKNLKQLNISNTAVDDIRPIENMKSIEWLDCSGTSIKNFKGIDELKNLKYLNVSNTRVWKLLRIYGLTKLEKLICYNTRLSQDEVDDFKIAFSECEVTYY
ncbi:leucine-rich repeat domain-containing protein [Ekhidna sp.]|uniref:leucine-rich repeat domain-containing protein n=1 Tax=Ekhidna sp. TaxID=2608089 RepID=UPI003CCBF2E7